MGQVRVGHRTTLGRSIGAREDASSALPLISLMANPAFTTQANRHSRDHPHNKRNSLMKRTDRLTTRFVRRSLILRQ
jgi:hypothetical protein